MRTRKDILTDLIQFNQNLTQLKSELSKYSWDLEEPILTIRKKDLLKILYQVIEKDLSLTNLENWANVLESRDDLEFEKPELQEIIFELANTEINGGINLDRLRELINYLNQL